MDTPYKFWIQYWQLNSKIWAFVWVYYFFLDLICHILSWCWFIDSVTVVKYVREIIWISRLKAIILLPMLIFMIRLIWKEKALSFLFFVFFKLLYSVACAVLLFVVRVMKLLKNENTISKFLFNNLCKIYIYYNY